MKKSQAEVEQMSEKSIVVYFLFYYFSCVIFYAS